MNTSLLNQWHFLRIFRLIIAIAIIIQAVFTKEWIIGIVGVLFAVMALFNVGCCGVNGCKTTQRKFINNNNHADEVFVEEVK